MATNPADGIATQIKNIEATYGKKMSDWAALIAKSGLTKHTDVVAMLKTKYGLAHGAAHRISLVTRDKDAAPAPAADAYAGKKEALRPIHAALITAIEKLGQFEVLEKKGYWSLVRGKQFAMIKPAAKHIDVGLVLKGEPVTERLESAASFNRLFTHRVRVASVKDVDAELRRWLKAAFAAAE